MGAPLVFCVRILEWLGADWSAAFVRYLTSLRFCCAANVVTASEAREVVAYRDSSNRLLGGGRDVGSGPS